MDAKMLKALLGKEEKEGGDDRMSAKMDVLKELIEMADAKETDGLIDGLQKITVAAPDKEGLEKGLEKAEEILEKGPEDMMPKEMMPEEMMESDEDDEDDEEDEEDEEEYR